MATLDSIQSKIAKLQSQAEAIKKKQSARVITEIHSLMSEHGLTVDDLGSTPAGKKYGGKHATTTSVSKSAGGAKYRDPKTGATWSGHGRAPGWIASARNRDRFLVDSGEVSVAAVGTKTAKPGNYRRGPQPALYRDPKSGATWSGRGKAPAWLAGAKDRTKFLIDGAAAKAADAKQSAPKAATAKKAGAKKATAAVSTKKSAAKKAAAKSAKKSASENATAKKSTSVAKKGPSARSKKAAGRKVAAKRSGGKVTPEVAADATTLLPASAGDVNAGSPAA
ncbi:H-NS family nucleoid-associated regulatory protein [Caballeronia grimmiae]|uniref:H-NS family nucleoid-associated regulatory protein n=1 Tax=Caballeronia grimmiae TaxID=1071679 RepID=UPI0038BC4492